jgi:tetratricopeptide (TPR) repeat protein
MGAVLVLLLLTAAEDPARLRDALVLEQAGNDAAAIAALDATIRAQPEWALPRIEDARIRLKSGGDLDRVELDLEAAQALAPENPRAHFLWGMLMEERGKTDEAIKALERALVFRADYDEAHARLADLYFQRQDWPNAELHYRAVVQAHPDQVPARLQLATVLEREGRTPEAESELRSLLADQPTSPLVARRLADFYDRTQRPKLAARIRGRYDPQAKRHLRALKKSRR